MKKRITTISLIVLAILALAAGTVLARGVFVLPEPDPEETSYAGDGEAEEVKEEIDPTIVFPAPAPLAVSVRDGMELPSFVDTLVLDLGDDTKVVSYNSQESAEWNSVDVQISSGDFVTISVQALASVSTPGGYIQPHWELRSVDGFEGAIEPRDESNNYEAVWILSEKYQVGVSLWAGPGDQLTMTPEESIKFLESTAASLGKRLDGLSAP